MKTRIVLFGLMGLVLVFSGSCKKYNRAAISADGQTLAFSLSTKGFETDETSEMYLFDVSTCTMKRVTFDREMDGWAELEGNSLLFIKGNEDMAGNLCLYEGNHRPQDTLSLAYGVGVTPLFLGQGEVFFSSIAVGKDKQKDSKILFNFTIGPYGSRTLAELPMDPENMLLYSTLPALHADVDEQKIYYAVAETKGYIEAVKKKQMDKAVFPVSIYSLDVATKRSSLVTRFEFKAVSRKPEEMPVGYVDLAISPDGGTLICCFLPFNKFSIRMFSDEMASRVFLVNVRTGEKRSFSSDKNMYYPQWKPADKTTTQPAASEPKFMYLSGTGFKSGRGVWITDLKGKAQKLADLPDKVMEGYTGWTWLTSQRIRIFHVGKSGLVLADVNEDGTAVKRRILRPERLMQVKHRADVEGMIGFLQKQDKDTQQLLHQISIKQTTSRNAGVIEELKEQLKKMGPSKPIYEYR